MLNCTVERPAPARLWPHQPRPPPALARPPQVTVFGKQAADPKYTEIASLNNGINWKAADRAKVVILPEEDEWPALAIKAKTL